MFIENKFKVLELNYNAGRLAGRVLTQFPVVDDPSTAVTVGANKYLQNGNIYALNNAGKIAVHTGAAGFGEMFIHCDDPIVTFGVGDNQFAVKNVNGDTYLRLYPLQVGDVFTTNNVAGTYGAFAKVVAGVITFETTATAATVFSAKQTTLANGDPGYEFIVIKPQAVTA